MRQPCRHREGGSTMRQRGNPMPAPDIFFGRGVAAAGSRPKARLLISPSGRPPKRPARCGRFDMRYLHTMVRVGDLDAALDFYCVKLGLKEVRRQDNARGRFTLVFLAAPD